LAILEGKKKGKKVLAFDFVTFLLKDATKTEGKN